MDYRLREFHAFQDDRCAFCTQGLTSSNVFKTDRSCNITSAYFFNFSTVCSSHLHQATDTFASTFYRVQYGITGFHHTRVNADESQLTNVFIIQHFERQCREFLFIAGLTAVGFFSVRVNTLNWRNVGRSRQQFYNCIQHTLNTFVFKC